MIFLEHVILYSSFCRKIVSLSFEIKDHFYVQFINNYSIKFIFDHMRYNMQETEKEHF